MIGTWYPGRDDSWRQDELDFTTREYMHWSIGEYADYCTFSQLALDSSIDAVVQEASNKLAQKLLEKSLKEWGYQEPPIWTALNKTN